MNPNRMMIAKASVAQAALREEARESRLARRERTRGDRKDHRFLGLLRRP